MKIGCNYWASHAGTKMWEMWDENIVRNDFKLMADAGMELVRVFPLWPDFQPLSLVSGWSGHKIELLLNNQPLPNTPCGRAGVDEVQLDRFATLCDIAEENNLKLIVGLVTGWMSGVLYMPPAFQGLNPINDPLALKWEIRMVRCLVKALKHKEAIYAWELGNESNCMGSPKSPDEAWLWTNAIASAVKLEDNSRPFFSGMHGIMPAVDEEFGAPTSWSIQTQGELCDVLTSHPYPHTTTKSSARLDPHDSIRLTLQAAIETRLYGDIARKPACVEEIGTFSSSYCNEQTKANFIRATMLNSWVHGSTAFLWWCAFEHSILNFPPYTHSTWERELGFYDENLKPRAIAKEFTRFIEFRDSMPFKELPPFKQDAVCVLTRGQDFNASLENAWSAFILAKQAGFDIQFQFIDEPLRDAKLYIVPGIQGTNWSRSFEFNALVQKAHQGATVFFDLDGGDLSPFESVFGATVVTRETRTEPIQTLIGGATASIIAPYRLVIQTTTAKTILTEQGGNPIFIQNNLGSGQVFLLTAPLERFTAKKPGAFTQENQPWSAIYTLIAENLIKQRAATSNDKLVTLTEHQLDDKRVAIIAVNNQAKPVENVLVVNPAWKVTWTRSQLIQPLDATAFILEKVNP